MDQLIIAMFSIAIGGSIPLVYIISQHRRQSKVLQLQILQEQNKLEKRKLAVYEMETEKLKLEVSNQKLQL